MDTFTTHRGAQVSLALDHTRNDLLTEIGRATLRDRYLMPGETFQTAFARVAAYFSDDQEMAQRMYDYISRHWFMPATPVLSNGGTDRGLPISCYLNSVGDSLDEIEATWSESVWLAARGGGIGTNWSDVRSIDEKVGEVGTTSGVVPFIKVQDSLTLAISQGSLRRGSAAVYLDISHPEIEEFLEIRKPGGGDFRRKALDIHHGITIPDAFMHAVKAGGDWNLVSPLDGSVRKVVKARDLWQKVLEVRLQTGEPYMVWTDTVNRAIPEVYKRNGLKVRQSNLCSEIMLHTGPDQFGKHRTAVCCLSSINAYYALEWFGNRQFVRDCLVFLDNVLEDFIRRTEGVRGFERANYAAKRERSIGCGMMGFQSFLQSQSIPMESVMAQVHNRRINSWLAECAEQINREVAEERGPCPDAADVGLMVRWSHTFATAPTATISLIAGTVSPGNDAYPANVFIQKTLSGSFEVWNGDLLKLLRQYADKLVSGDDAAKEAWLAEVKRSISANDGSVQHLAFMEDHDKDVYKTALEIDQRYLVTMMGDRASKIDQGASNNIFLPGDAQIKDLHGIHWMAWEKGCKSLYYLRSKSTQRGSKTSHIAGEMPTARDPSTVTLTEVPEAANPLGDLPVEVSKYEECLVCQ